MSGQDDKDIIANLKREIDILRDVAKQHRLEVRILRGDVDKNKTILTALLDSTAFSFISQIIKAEENEQEEECEINYSKRGRFLVH